MKHKHRLITLFVSTAIALSLLQVFMPPLKVHAAPRNDLFANATIIPPFTVVQDTSGASLSSSDPIFCHAVTDTVWFRYTPAATQTIIARTIGSDYDTVLVAFTGSESNLTVVACNDDIAPGIASEVSFTAAAGITYAFAVGRSTSQGSISTTLKFTLEELPATTNDLIDNSEAVSSLPYSHREDVSSTTSVNDPMLCTSGGTAVNTVWFRYTSPINQLIDVSTLGSNYDTVLAAFSGTTTNLVSIDCNDDFPNANHTSRFRINATAGVTYYFIVGSVNAPSTPALLQFNLGTPIANDEINGALVIPAAAANYSNNQNTVFALPNSNDPPLCGVANNTVWYRYTPTTSKIVNVDTSGSAYDTVLAIYIGTPNALIQRACGNNASPVDLTSLVSGFYATAGTTYYIMVANNEPSPLSNDLKLNFSVRTPSCTKAIDVMFVVEGSSKVFASDWELMKGFINNVAASFMIGSSAARLGIIQFSTGAALTLDLSSNATSVYQTVSSMSQLGGSVNVAAGLSLAQSRLMATGRSGVYHAIILLTADKNDIGGDPVAVANSAKLAGIRLSSVGMGASINAAQLNAIATDPDSLFMVVVPNAAQLTSALQNILAETCIAAKQTKDTFGIFRPSSSTFYLRNSNTTGYADISANFGGSTDLPLVGDWNGDGIATIGVYRSGQFLLKDVNSSAAPIVYSFVLGVPGDLPMAGRRERRWSRWRWRIPSF
ncbi:MAG: VWA domain-containing protein [Chloroflexota bacterium]